MRAPGSSPVGDAAPAGWLESCRSWRVPSGRGKRRALKPADRRRQTSSAVAGVVAAVVEVAAVAEAAIDPARAGSRSRFRVRHVRSGGRREGSARTPHPEPPGELPHPGPPGEPLHPGPPRQRRKEIGPTSDDDGGGVGGVDAARDRTVRRQLAAPRVAGRHQADNPRLPKFAGIEWTNGALP
jgi:hypothetical protein